MKAHAIIELAASPWANNVVLVHKKDNSLRFCKRWSQSSLIRLRRKIDNYIRTTERKSGSGRPRSVRTAVNISTFDDMICSQMMLLAATKALTKSNVKRGIHLLL